MMNNFIGKDNFVWWTGVVERINDPLQLGRCKVRIFGWHTDDLNAIPTDDLPWASIISPATSSQSFTTFREGDYVMGFFLDGMSGQNPAIIGMYPGIEVTAPNTNKGFSPQGPTTNIPTMPEGQIARSVGQPTTAPLARGVVANTAIAFTNADLAHVCGFKFNLNFNIDLGLGELTAVKELATALQRGIQAGKKGVADVVRAKTTELVTTLRTAINTIIKAIGAADVTGVFSYSFSQLKSLTRKLNSFLSQAAEMAYNAGLAIGVVQGIQELINWIATLPAQIKSVVQNCLTNFTNSVKGVVKTINAVPSQIESSVKSQFSTFTSSLDQSINSIKSQVTTSNKGQTTTMLNVLNGDSSTSSLDSLAKLLEPPSKEQLLKSATQSSLQRP